MGDWSFGCGLGWAEYLEAERFSGAAGPGLRRVERTIETQTGALLGGVESLRAAGFEASRVRSEENAELVQAIERSSQKQSGEILGGIEQLRVSELENSRIHSDENAKLLLTIERSSEAVLSKIDDVLGILDAGFADMLATLDDIHLTLKDLVKIARTPAQTAAYEQYSIARDAYRQQLFPECLESLHRAIEGDATSSGYKLEWRFHYVRALVRMGSPRFSDHESVDLGEAERSFALAGRYARTDTPLSAACSFLGAGRAAFLQSGIDPGKLKTARGYLTEALKLRSGFFEAFYLNQRVRAALGERSEALEALRPWILRDERLLVRVCSEGEFVATDALADFMTALQREVADELSTLAQGTFIEFNASLERFSDILTTEPAVRIRRFFDGSNGGLLDLLRYRRAGLAADRSELLRQIAKHDEETERELAKRRNALVTARMEMVEADVQCLKSDVVYEDVEYEVQKKSFFSSKTKVVRETMRLPSQVATVSTKRVQVPRIVLRDAGGNECGVTGRVDRKGDWNTFVYLSGQKLQTGAMLRTMDVWKRWGFVSGVPIHEWTVLPTAPNFACLPVVTASFFNEVMPYDRAPEWLREYERDIDEVIRRTSSKKLYGFRTAHFVAREFGPFFRAPRSVTWDYGTGQRSKEPRLGLAWVSREAAFAFCNVLAERLGTEPVYKVDARQRRVDAVGRGVRPRMPTDEEFKNVREITDDRNNANFPVAFWMEGITISPLFDVPTLTDLDSEKFKGANGSNHQDKDVRLLGDPIPLVVELP